MVICRLLTSEIRVRSQVRPCGICDEQVALGQVLLGVLRFLLVSVTPPLLHIHSCIIWGLENGPVSRRTSIETWSYPLATIAKIR
jgi:hypothetical protein